MTTLRGQPIDPAPAGVVIAFWPWGDAEEAGVTLRALLAGAPAPTPVALPDDRKAARLLDAVGGPDDERISMFGGSKQGLARFLESVADAHPGADLALVADAGQLPSGWLDHVLAAARADDTVSAATSFAVGGREPPFPLLEASEARMGREPARESSTRSTPSEMPSTRAQEGVMVPSLPRVLAPWPHCSVIRRSAYALLGGVDESFTHPRAALLDFAARARGHGMSCALAPEVVIKRFGEGPGACPEAEIALLHRRHPWLARTQSEEAAPEVGVLRHQLVAVRAASHRPSVTIDARALGSGVGGTQTFTAALVLALARSGLLSIRAVVAETDAEISEVLAAGGAEVIGYRDAVAGVERTDIVHRPQQVFTPSDLALLRLLGERIVISHMDLIAYRAASYHRSVDDWHSYRRTTRLALACADRALFFSEHARRDAISEELIPSDRAVVAGMGVDRPPAATHADRPARVPPDRDLLLLLGSDYGHKNRPFALSLVDELRRRYGWDGLLVMAGSHVDHGSSAAAEADFLRTRPALAEHVVDLGLVSEAEKRWLLRAAVAHLCTSNYEGFGLAPLEAAAADRPCIYAPCTSLGEIVDRRAATIVPWDVAASAAGAAVLLKPGPGRDAHLELLRDGLRRYTWPEVTEQIFAAYAAALASPYPGGLPRAWEEVEREQLLAEVHAAFESLQVRTSRGLALIDTQGPLLTSAQQRGLMRVAVRPWLRGPLLGGFGLLGLDHRDRTPGDDG